MARSLGKLAPRPESAARAAGVAVMATGVFMIARALGVAWPYR